jgi:hypothetical protein
MGNEAAIQRTVVSGKTRMTPSEAFVETLVANGVTDVFGIVGSAYMDALDIFPPPASASSRWRTSRAPATWPTATRASRVGTACA